MPILQSKWPNTWLFSSLSAEASRNRNHSKRSIEVSHRLTLIKIISDEIVRVSKAYQELEDKSTEEASFFLGKMQGLNYALDKVIEEEFSN